MDMSGTAEIGSHRLGIGKRTQCHRAVMSRDSGSTPGKQIDGNGERSSEHRGVVLNLMGKPELLTTRYCQRSAKLAASIGDHEIDMFRRNLLCGHDQVALVLAVFIINHNNETSGTEFFYSLLDSVEANFFIVTHRMLDFQLTASADRRR